MYIKAIMYIFLKKESLNICYKDQTVLNSYEIQLYIISLLSLTPSTVALLQRMPASTRTFCDSCSAQRNSKETRSIYPCVKHHMN